MSTPTPTLHPATSLRAHWPELIAVFSTALPRQPDAELSQRLRAELGEMLQRGPHSVAPPLLLRQTHSAAVVDVEGAPCGPPNALDAADGARGSAAFPRLLAVKTADCVPLLAVDPASRRYAALHAGWRGTAGGILPALLAAWQADGAAPAALWLELGPHIRGCCYEVKADCLERFGAEARATAVAVREGSTYLDLATVLRAQAERAGVAAAHIRVSNHCTFCHRNADGSAPYASHRRAIHTGEALCHTNVGIIGLPGP